MRLTPSRAVRAARGVTLTELLVGISIVAILLGLGVPSISGYIQSARMNSAAQSYLSGVQTARTEAIRRNLPVEFVLTDTPVETANLADNLAPGANGQNWVVRAPDPTRPAPAFVLVESHSATEGSGSAQPPSVLVQGVLPAGFTGIIPFNGFGGTADNYQLDISNPPGGACAQFGGPMRCPSIRVPAGGLARLCDPAAPNAPADSRGC